MSSAISVASRSSNSNLIRFSKSSFCLRCGAVRKVPRNAMRELSRKTDKMNSLLPDWNVCGEIGPKEQKNSKWNFSSGYSLVQMWYPLSNNLFKIFGQDVMTSCWSIERLSVRASKNIRRQHLHISKQPG